MRIDNVYKVCFPLNEDEAQHNLIKDSSNSRIIKKGWSTIVAYVGQINKNSLGVANGVIEI